MKALIYSEKASEITDAIGFLHVLSEELNQDFDVYALSLSSEEEVSKEGVKGLEKIYIVDKGTTKAISDVLSNLYSEHKPDIVLGPTTKNSTEILARLAAKNELPMITEVAGVIGLDGDVHLEKPIMGGRALAVYRFTTPILATVPAKKFKPKAVDTTPSIEKLSLPEEDGYKLIDVKPKEKGAVDIEAAEIVVGVGRGFKNKDDLDLAFNIAEIMGGEVGCTRPIAADYNWLGEDRWIGISGKKIRGKLYFAIGISGAPQHIMAAMDSKVIVVVNKDKNAPIFQYSDYGIIADLYQFLPVFIEKLREKLGK
jgi:electron transfer flavoprotein alpha subunit